MALLAASCMAASVPGGRQAESMQAGRAESAPATGMVPAEPDLVATGVLRLTINWPRRDAPGFSAATLPQSANSVGVFVLQGSTVLRQVTVSRPADGSPTSVSIRLGIGNDLTVAVKAYREPVPDLATAIPIALGSATGVNIVSARTTARSITLAPLNAPAISAISPNPVRPGETVTIEGANLGPVGGVVPVVNLAGLRVSTVTAVAGALQAVIPADAVTGNVTITSDGLTSASSALLLVASDLAIDAPRAAFDTGPAGTRMVRYGQTMQFGATATYRLGSGKSPGDFAPLPVPTWQSSAAGPGAANTVDSSGLFTAAQANKRTRIDAKLGSLTSNAITAIPVGVDGVTLSAAAINVNALLLSGVASQSWMARTAATVGATVSTSLPFNGGVSWTVSDPTRVSANSSTGSAVISAVNGAQNGAVILTASAIDDTRFTATAAVNVTTLGGMLLEVD